MTGIMIGFFFVGIAMKIGELIGDVIAAILTGLFKCIVRMFKTRKKG